MRGKWKVLLIFNISITFDHSFFRAAHIHVVAFACVIDQILFNDTHYFSLVWLENNRNL